MYSKRKYIVRILQTAFFISTPQVGFIQFYNQSHEFLPKLHLQKTSTSYNSAKPKIFFFQESPGIYPDQSLYINRKRLLTQ